MRTKESKASIFADLLAFNEELSFDIVLTWDLFNYLDLAATRGSGSAREPLLQTWGRTFCADFVSA